MKGGKYSHVVELEEPNDCQGCSVDRAGSTSGQMYDGWNQACIGRVASYRVGIHQ